MDAKQNGHAEQENIVVQPEDVEILIQVVVTKQGMLHIKYPKHRPTDALQVLADVMKHVSMQAGQAFAKLAGTTGPKVLIPNKEQAQQLLGVS
jgi:hypothetical protein